MELHSSLRVWSTNGRLPGLRAKGKKVKRMNDFAMLSIRWRKESTKIFHLSPCLPIHTFPLFERDWNGAQISQGRVLLRDS